MPVALHYGCASDVARSFSKESGLSISLLSWESYRTNPRKRKKRLASLLLTIGGE